MHIQSHETNSKAAKSENPKTRLLELEEENGTNGKSNGSFALASMGRTVINLSRCPGPRPTEDHSGKQIGSKIGIIPSRVSCTDTMIRRARHEGKDGAVLMSSVTSVANVERNAQDEDQSTASYRTQGADQLQSGPRGSVSPESFKRAVAMPSRKDGRRRSSHTPNVTKASSIQAQAPHGVPRTGLRTIH